MDPKSEARWYIDAVRSTLILKGMTREEAEMSIKKYMLKEELERCPEILFSHSVSATIKKMQDTGCIKRTTVA